MPSEHKARPGDCVCSVALSKGLDPQKVWDAPENEKIRDRTDVWPKGVPEILLPTDPVYLPDRQTKWESRADGQYHPFKVKTIPLRLKIKFLDQGQPRANLAYILQINGKKIEGSLDADGLLDQPLPHTATDVRIRLGDPDSGEDYFVKLGHLDPVGRITGMQQRLHNLGYNPGSIDGIYGPRTRTAMLRFQLDNQLASSTHRTISATPFPDDKDGDPDDETLQRLVELHGC